MGEKDKYALPGYLITAPPSVCVPDVLGALAVWIQNQKKEYIYTVKLRDKEENMELQETQDDKQKIKKLKRLSSDTQEYRESLS